MKSKRFAALLLSVLLLVGMIPMYASADEVENGIAAESAEGEEAVVMSVVEETYEKDSYGHNLIPVEVDASLYPACSHEQRNSGDTYYEFSYPGAEKLVVTFSSQSELLDMEYLEVFDSNGNYIGYYDAWRNFAGESFIVNGSYFKMKLYSQWNAQSYGFEIESIEAIAAEHVGSEVGSYLAPTCTEDGHEAGFICDICENDIHGAVLPSMGHSYVESVVEPTAEAFGYTLYDCSACSDSYKGKFRPFGDSGSYGDIHDTMSWIIQGDTLYILGSGEMPNDGKTPAWSTPMVNEGVKSVVISEGITLIGEKAFYNKSGITSVTIPSTVTSIGDSAFYGTKMLKSITLPEKLTGIGRSTFYGSGLTSITFPDTVRIIGQYTFANCYDLAEIDFGSGVETIELQAFQNCRSLTSVFFPYNVDYIAQSAFRYCSKLQEITFGLPVARGGFGDGLSLGIEAFAYCDLREVNLPDHTYSIDGGTFTCNPRLTAINVSTTQTLNSIEGPKYLTDSYGCVYEYDMDFTTNTYYPYNLVALPGALSGSYTVPDCVRTIEAEIRDMPNLTSFTFGAGYGGILNAYAYVNCPKLTQVKAGGSPDDSTIWYNDASGALLSKYADDETAQLYFVPADAVKYTIPANVNRIASEGALTNAKLTGISVEAGNTYFKSIDGVLYSYDGTMIVAYPSAKASNSFYVPETVEDIKSSAFTDCTQLTNIYFTGDFSWFEFDAFGTHAITIWYPENNDTWDPEMLEDIAGEYGMAYGANITFKPYSGEEPVEVTAPTNVKGTTVASTGKPKLTWDKVDGAVQYEIWRSTTKSGKGSKLTTQTGTSYTSKKADAGTNYYFYVKAVGTDGTVSENSERVLITCDYAAPTVSVSGVASSGSNKLTWGAVENATSYNVYRSTKESGTYTKLKNTTTTSYTDTTAKAGTKYYYKVKSLGSNESAISAYSAVVSRVTDLARPTITLSNVTSSGKIKVSWKKVDEAAKYEVYRATSKTGTYKLQKTTTSLSWTDTGATAGKTYYYKVKAVHGNTYANSALTDYKYRTADLARPTVTLSNVASSGNVKVSWTKSDGAVDYQVYRATSKTGTYKLQKTTTSLSWTDTNTTAGKTYYYKVKATHSNANANSEYSEYKHKMADLKTPVISITKSLGKPKVSWNDIDGAKEYKIYRASSKSGTYSLVKTTTGTSWRDTTAAKGKTYYYKVMAVHSSSAANSAYSGIKYIECTK